MAIEFEKGGIIRCNTIKYNYKQVRNLIADNCYGNISGTGVWQNVVASTNPAGYKSYRAFTISTTPITQNIGKIVDGHKYYHSFRMYMTENQEGVNAAWFELCFKYNNNEYVSAGIGHTKATGGNWVLVSEIINADGMEAWNPHYAKLYCRTGSTGVMLMSRLILIDLTEAFGAGNEPTKEWCDNNIREQETYVNFGCLSSNITPSNYNSYFTISNGNAWVDNANYLQVDDAGDVRDYQLYFQVPATLAEGTLTSKSSFTINVSATYYFQLYERHGTLDGSSIDGTSSEFYFPVAEPTLGSAKIPLVANATYNGGGGMKDWKRVSMFGSRTGFSSGSYPMRIDFNNEKKAMHFWVTGIQLTSVGSVITEYNNYNGTSVTMADVNKEWCDRWIDGRGSPIIHIKDPNNVQIDFEKPSYDIICNDIEIRPELNEIQFDKTTGTIRCKKLIRAQCY